MEDYITGIEKVGMDVWNSIIEGPHKNSKNGEVISTVKEYLNLQERYSDIPSDKKAWIEADLKAKREQWNGSAAATARSVAGERRFCRRRSELAGGTDGGGIAAAGFSIGALQDWIAVDPFIGSIAYINNNQELIGTVENSHNAYVDRCTNCFSMICFQMGVSGWFKEISMEGFDENDAVVKALSMLYKVAHKVFVEMPKREKGKD
ncbi:hypothetical protein LXL04_023682 [Taraxacum kok-saghyz]